MIETNRLRLEVADYRAVHKAEIVIGDITVLSGVNACGKSTIAHLFHSLVNLNRDYERFAVAHAWNTVQRSVRMVTFLQRRLLRLGRVRASEVGHRDSFATSRQLEMCCDCTIKRRIVESLLTQLSKQCVEAERKSPDDVHRYICAFMRDVEEECDSECASFEVVADYFTREMNKASQLLEKLMTRRTRRVWEEADSEAVKWVDYPGSVMLSESDKCVCRFGGKGRTCLNEILNVDHAFYIESPWRNKPAVMSDGRMTIGDGFTAVGYEREWKPDADLFAALEGEIAEDPDGVEAEYADDLMFQRDQWMYARKDGHEPFPLEECATGIKSLSILNFLYTRNFLGNKTLLIIDEPEAHLHPQWILEYAKILVRLNRRLGVRLLITTHSPGMLDAIRRVANVEEVPELRFYLAEEVSNERKYDFVYRDLGRQVEPIFAKFNLASDRTEAYPDELA